MTPEEKQKANEKIGKILGFKKVVTKYGTHWNYPSEYEDLVCSSPNNALPDFITMFNIVLELQLKLRNGIPREFFYDKKGK